MAFKNLEERFTATAKELYGHASTRDGPGDQPYVEYKPDNPNRNETTNDTRFLPIGSTKRDVVRIGKFLGSPDGLLFLGKQALLQTGNTFSETRIFNPLFVVGNVVPGTHLPRVLTGQNAFTVQGDQTEISPPSLDPKIFSAGRLQKATSANAISSVVGGGGSKGLLSLLSPANLVKSLASVFSLKDNGTLGVNERPELDIDDQYFCVSLWKGFKKLNSPQSNLASAAANLRSGNFAGAAKSLKSAGSDLVNGTAKRIPDSPLLADGRNTPGSDYDGRRYFFTVNADDERYMQYSVEFTSDSDGRTRPVVSMPFAAKTPYYVDVNDPLSDIPVVNASQTVSFEDKLTKAVTPSVRLVGPSSFNAEQTANAAQALSSAASAATGPDNPAEDSMHFADISLRQRYKTDERLDFVRTSLDAQKQRSFDYWKDKSPLAALGFKDSNKINIGAENDIDPTIYRGGKYLSDVSGIVVDIDSNGKGLDSDSLDTYQTLVGENTVLVIFYDFGSKTAIPFRAMMTGLTEVVYPEIRDTRYIGRIERNIVYAGVTREVSFQLNVHAFSEAELDTVWEKIRHMTGLCFPANYDNGYIVPPFVKLTLGDIYHDQPGYIRQLTHNIDDDVSWEVDGRKVPHGITMNVSYCIIEKNQAKTKSLFYAINQES